MRACAALSLLLVGCERETSTSSEGDPPTPSVEAPSTKEKKKAKDPCPSPKPEGDAPVLIADEIILVHRAMPLRWYHAVEKRYYELAAEPLRPKDLGGTAEIKGAVWDDKYFYRVRCFEDCGNRTSMGNPLAVERIDRSTGESVRLGKGAYGLNGIVLHGDHVYWGVRGSPNMIGGGVTRVAKAGGTQERIRIDNGSDHDDKVSRLQPYPDGILVEGERTLAWIPANGDPPRKILEVERQLGPAVRDGDSYYVAEEGDPYWQSKDSGYIHRITIADGKDTKLVGPVRWPSAITTYRDTIYYMLKDSPEVWSLPKDGGKPHVAVRRHARAEACDESVGIWADERGLFWLRARKEFMRTGRERLYFLPWTAVSKP
jgi:hypothetical protein